jgi:hypothetical protein
VTDYPESRRAADSALTEATQTLRALTSKIDLLARAVESREAQIEESRAQTRWRILWGIALSVLVVAATVLLNGVWVRYDVTKKINHLTAEEAAHRARNEAENKCSGAAQVRVVLETLLLPVPLGTTPEQRIDTGDKRFVALYDPCTQRLSGIKSFIEGASLAPERKP